MNKISLDLRGTAKWFEFVGCDVSRPQKAPQISVLEAVRFVMEQLRPEIRGSAWIDTSAGSLGIGDIQVMYPTIRCCPRPATDAERLASVPDLRIDTSTWDVEGGAQTRECVTPYKAE
jgi:hypothetical protein